MERIIVALVVLLICCANNTEAQQRIVTAGSSSSEIVCALGACDQIIATDRTSLYPEKLQSLPSIGYRNGINAEGIIAQKPELIILEQDYVKEELINQLQSTDIKTLVVEKEGNIKSTKQRISVIAQAIGKEKEGALLIQEIETELEAVKQKVKAGGEKPKVLCVYARGQGNMMVAGKNTSFSILELAGAQNAVPEIDGFKPLNLEALIQANPDYILFFKSGLQSIGGKEKALQIPGVRQTTAGKEDRIIAMDGILLTNWGPRVAEAANKLFQLTHPEKIN